MLNQDHRPVIQYVDLQDCQDWSDAKWANLGSALFPAPIPKSFLNFYERQQAIACHFGSENLGKAGGDVQSARFENKYIFPYQLIRQLDEYRHLLYSGGLSGGKYGLIPDQFTMLKVEEAIRTGVVDTVHDTDFLAHGFCGYPVHSLYLDSEGKLTFYQQANGQKNRFKLRIRFYKEILDFDNPNEFVFLEVKRKVDNVIFKTRSKVHASIAQRICDDLDYEPEVKDLAPAKSASERSKWEHGLHNFLNLRRNIKAVPAKYTSYKREGSEIAGSNHFRTTLDYDVRGASYNKQLSAMGRDAWVLNEHGGIIVELKFNGRFPDLYLDLVQRFNMKQSGAAKYGGTNPHLKSLPSELGARFDSSITGDDEQDESKLDEGR